MPTPQRDVTNSLKAGQAEIWGDAQKELFDTGVLTMGPRGVAGLCDAVGGPSPAGSHVPQIASYRDYVEQTTRAGLKPEALFDVPAAELPERFQAMLVETTELPLSVYGKEQLRSIMDRAVAATQSDANLERLADITPPDKKAAGATRVALADLPTEREALLVKISEADDFIYVPGFVLTRAVAGAIVARRDELSAQGKALDVKIVADSGVYPGGSTPNSYGVKYLEDNGILPRWSRLTRAGHHDRKIHAKQLITDKGEMFGRTNFSKKGMRDNWEHSGFVAFDPADPESVANREASVAQFNDLWEHETFELSTLELAGRWNQNRPELGRAWFVEDSREGAIKKIIGAIETYEEQSGEWMLKKCEDPAIQARIKTLEESGMAHGYAALKAVEAHLGTEAMCVELDQLPANLELQALKGRPGISTPGELAAKRVAVSFAAT